MAVVRREELSRWIAGYEKAWREPGTGRLSDLFTHDVIYSPSPWSAPVQGLAALGEFWESRRSGPDERFTMATDSVALENERAVVRVSVTYHDPETHWRDLWVLHFSAGGRCSLFEEWPYAPNQEDGQSG